MRNPRVLIFPVLAVLVAIVVFFFGQGGETPIDDPSGTVVEAPEEDGEDVRVEPERTQPDELEARVVAERREAPVASSGEHASYTAALGGLTGRLVWEKSEEPLVGVEVRAIEARVDMVVPTVEEAWDLVDGGNPLTFRVRTKTDAKGRFVLRGLHPRAIHLLGIGLGTETAAVRFVAETPRSGQTIDMGDVEILRRGTVKGVVQDAQGNPVAGARVRGLDIPQIAFQFGVGDFRPDGVLFGRMGSQAVVVPMPEWVAEIDALLPFADTRTAADGSFTLAGVRAGAVTVLAQKAGQLPLFRTTRVRAEQERNVGTLRFKRGSSVKLRFVDSDGNAVDTVRVAGGRMFAMAPIGLCNKPERVDAEGKFELRGLPRGKVHAVWQLRRGAPWQSVGPLRDGETKTVTVPTLRSALVKIVDEKGEPLADVQPQIEVISQIAAFVGQMPLAGILPKVRAEDIEKVADKPGEYRVRNLLAGKYQVHARADGYAVGAAELEVQKGKDSVAELVLVRGATADFVVVDAEKNAVAGAHVYWNARRGTPKGYKGARMRSPIPVAIGKTDDEGKLRVQNVPAGATRFIARHPAHAVVADNKSPVQAGKAMTLQLGELGKLDITVTERGSRPSERVSLLLEPRISGDGEPFVPPRFVMTDEQGHVLIDGIQPCDWRVERAPPLADYKTIDDLVKAMQLRNRTNTVVRAKVQPGQTAKVVLELDRMTQRMKFTGSIHVTARVDGKPLTGFKLQAWGQHSENAEFDAAGRAALTHLEDGRYWLNIRDTDSVPPRTLWNKTVEVKDGKRVDFEVALLTGSVALRVRDKDGLPIAGVAVQLNAQKGGVNLNNLTNEDGAAEFASVPVGKYTVRVHARRDGHDDILVPSKQVEVAQGARAEVELRGVLPAYIEGTVTLDVSGLNPQEREAALEMRPSWGQFDRPDGSSGGARWVRLGDWAEASTQSSFERVSLAPGTYRFRGQGWGRGASMTWRSADILLPQAGLAGAQVLLRPDPKDLERVMKKKNNKK